MDIILVPGLWLDASSWDDVTPALEAAGHHPTPMTLPGIGEPAERSAEIGMSDWVDAVVAQIDDSPGPVVLVGHSGGGDVIWGAAGARPERVARAVFVDTVPPPPDQGLPDFDVVDGVVPFPGWGHFPEEDVFDLDDETRARAAALTQSVPAGVPSTPVQLNDDRHRVPVTLLVGGMDQTDLEGALEEWGPYEAEYRAIDDVTVMKIGSGHWPQFSVPERLAALINESVAHSQATVDGDDRA